MTPAEDAVHHFPPPRRTALAAGDGSPSRTSPRRCSNVVSSGPSTPSSPLSDAAAIRAWLRAASA